MTVEEYDVYAIHYIRALRHELEEARSEIARHHRDFERIRGILDDTLPVLAVAVLTVPAAALRRIRNIVG